MTVDLFTNYQFIEAIVGVADFFCRPMDTKAAKTPKVVRNASVCDLLNMT